MQGSSPISTVYMYTICRPAYMSICPFTQPSNCSSVFSSVYLLVCLFVLCICLSTCPPVHLSIYICLSVLRLFVHPSVFLSVRPSFFLCICISVRSKSYISARLFLAVSICMSVYLSCSSVCPPVHHTIYLSICV